MKEELSIILPWGWGLVLDELRIDVARHPPTRRPTKGMAKSCFPSPSPTESGAGPVFLPLPFLSSGLCPIPLCYDHHSF